MYLTEAEDDGLARVARAQKRSRAAVARDAITEYVARNAPSREWKSFGMGDSAARGFPPLDHDRLDEILADIVTKEHQEEIGWPPSSTPDP